MFFTRGTAKPAKPARQRVHDPRYPIRIRHTDVRPEYGWVLTPHGKAYAIALDCLAFACASPEASKEAHCGR